MKKLDFLKKWAKRATEGGPAEAFEADVEALMAETIRVTIRGVARGLDQAAAASSSYAQERILRDVATNVVPAVEKALMRLNGIEEEGGKDAPRSP